jgi:hypothetical protein
MGKHQDRPPSNCSVRSIGALYQSEGKKATASVDSQCSAVYSALLTRLPSSVTSELSVSLSRGSSSRHNRLAFHLFFARILFLLTTFCHPKGTFTTTNWPPFLRSVNQRANRQGVSIGSDDFTHLIVATANMHGVVYVVVQLLLTCCSSLVRDAVCFATTPHEPSSSVQPFGES